MAEYDCETTYIAPRDIGIARSADGKMGASIESNTKRYGEKTLTTKVDSPWQCAAIATDRLEGIWNKELKGTRNGPYTSDDMPMMRFKVVDLGAAFENASGLLNLSENIKNGVLLRGGPQIQASGMTDSGGYVAVYEGKGTNEQDRVKFASRPIPGM